MRAFRYVTPNFFAIPFGIAGLALVWSVAGQLYGVSAWVGEALFAVATVGWLLLVVLYVGLALVEPASVARFLRDPILAPFCSLAAIIGMLLAMGLLARERTAGVVLFAVCLGAATLFGGWTMGQLRTGVIDLQRLHSGYLLPTVAGGLIGASGAALAGLPQLGWISFGLGAMSWLVLSSVLLSRLLSGSMLPAPVVPTLAIEVAPAPLAGSAYFLLTGNRVDAVALALVGYSLLMVLVQVTLLALYMQTPFTLGFWSFTFPWTAVAVYALRWIAVERPAAAAALGALALAAVTILVAGVAARSIVALWQGRLLPAPPRAAAPGPRGG